MSIRKNVVYWWTLAKPTIAKDPHLPIIISSNAIQPLPKLLQFLQCFSTRVCVSCDLSANFPIQVNLFHKLLFLHQLTHNMTTDCSLNYKLNTWKFQAQTWGEYVVYRFCFWYSEQFLYTTCSPMFCKKRRASEDLPVCTGLLSSL